MKTETEVKLEVTMKNIDTKGTSLKGYFPGGTTYQDLVKTFGKPNTDSEMVKTKAEWTGKINGHIFTIYDYKSELEPEENTDWHIGGKDKETAVLVITYFYQNK